MSLLSRDNLRIDAEEDGMIRAWKFGVGLMATSWALLGPAAASAQGMAGSSTGSGMPPASMMANPYLNPYLNPYMNPLATQRPMSGGNALLYLYAANSANGGMGSGRLSGTRGGPQATGRGKAAEMPNAAVRPGAGAAHYFNPGPGGGGGLGRYYSQRGRYFNNNGR